ncbi:MAG: prolyl oligopeptidase family serine peptidase [Candidatus Electrothrix sp. Rat3]|nr:prolyl oligopeptidase family serine peptidase [Candidatus Electrothrix rattekaaiensis]
MKRMIIATVLLVGYLVIAVVAEGESVIPGRIEPSMKSTNNWKSPPENFLKVLHAPRLPQSWISPPGKYLLLGDPVPYPPLTELSAPMYKLAGIRVNPVLNGYHGQHGYTSPRLVNVDDEKIVPLDLPEKSEVYAVKWTVDGQRFALVVGHSNHIGLWVGSVDGKIKKTKDIAINPLLGLSASWLPDQKRLLVRRIPPSRGPVPPPPAIPAGPKTFTSQGETARSTYEARNLLETKYDESLFEYYATSELVVIDPVTEQIQVIGKPDFYTTAQFSPDGKYLLIKRLVGPWSHEVAYRRFASKIELWDNKGKFIAQIASLPLADQVPVHGVRTGPRAISWRPTAHHSIFWIEALDGGDPVAKVPHRDRLMRLEAPFTSKPQEVFLAEHRIQPWRSTWGAEKGTLMITQRERIRRRRYVWLLDVDNDTARLWFDLDEKDRYDNPGSPLLRPLPNGRWVLHQKGNAIYFRGKGATDQGDRPFLDLKDMDTGKVERLFRCTPDSYEQFIAFSGNEDHFILHSESATDVPNYYRASLGKKITAIDGEASRLLSRVPITHFQDPIPELRGIKKQIVRYTRKDGVPLSFKLYLPPNYKEGTALPTVLHAYPREYSNANIAGQVRGSAQRFMRLYGYSSLFFLLDGYAVLHQTAMPMIGDPETVYDSFVPQLVADAEAAVAKAVEMGITDPHRIGVIGHSHGGLMVANLLAHTDLFQAGIARSGSYNKTNQPFGFQSERRSLFEAQKVYLDVSPLFFAHQIKEPILLIHGNDDSNPGTLTFQSEVFFEAIRGSEGTAKLVLLPFEDHGYRAKESIEHVLWEQLQWFEKYVKNAPKSMGEKAVRKK